jgi:succinate dehydrogenase / fumarate reductase membrane anchor subunit
VNTRTPLSRVEGLGAAHSGVGHFWRQRVTAVALAPLAVWFACVALSLIGADRDAAVAFLRMPVNAVPLGLFVVIAAIHMALGVQVVIEDYIHHEGRKIVLLVLNQFFAWIVTAASLFALVKIAL